ncbi:MAG: hypothetical protein FJ096_16330 [Deltaproteobacteria bacterium]|nr:hypothetical protein [Deltaproteobacteria bacterium]
MQAPSAAAEGSSTADPARERRARILLDGTEVAIVTVDSLATPRPLHAWLAPRGVEPKAVLAIRVRSTDERQEVGVDRPLELHPDEVPTFHRSNGAVAFGLALKGGGYTPNLVDVGTVEVVTRRADAEVERTLVVAGRSPVRIDEELFRAAMGPDPDGEGSRAAASDVPSGSGRGGRGEGRGDGSGEGEGNGEHGGGGRRRLGVTLAAFVARHAKGVAVKEVLLVAAEKTIAVDAKLLADPTVELRLKLNNEGALRFRHHRGEGQVREIVEELRDVQRIEVR